MLADLAEGRIDIVIGTHAILTETVRFKSLAVAVIDEQHRFGVHQRAALREKGAGREQSDRATKEERAGAEGRVPHVLVMTATPIPRTMAITIFGDLDVSIIKGLPPGRKKITTMLANSSDRERMYKGVERRLSKDEQAYVVVPTIEGGEIEAGEGLRKELKGVEVVVAELEKRVLPGRRIVGLHGQLPREERETIMEQFRKGEIDVLVATTVIEVGVDVPNATVMVVENADRFGLAQLHQLRGRVGRSEKESVCVLIADPPADSAGDLARGRLQVMAATSDGFKIAEKDFELRGPGEFFGTKQSGISPLKIADLLKDRALLQMATRDAAAWIKASPTLSKPEESLLKKRLMKAHGEFLGLVDVG